MAVHNIKCALLAALLLCCLIAVKGEEEMPVTTDAVVIALPTTEQVKAVYADLANITAKDVDFIETATARHVDGDVVHDGDLEGFEYVCKKLTADEAAKLSEATGEIVSEGTEVCDMQQKEGAEGAEGGRFLGNIVNAIKKPLTQIPIVGDLIPDDFGDVKCKLACGAAAAGSAVACAPPHGVATCLPGVAGAIATCSGCPDILCHSPPVQLTTSVVCKGVGCYKLPGGIQGHCKNVCKFCGHNIPPPPSTLSSKTCSGSCGKKSPHGCWCDDVCVKYNDCCPDKQAKC